MVEVRGIIMQNSNMLLLFTGGLAVIVLMLISVMILMRRSVNRNKEEHQQRQQINPPTDEITNIKYAYSVMKHVGGREEQQDALDILDGSNQPIAVDFAGVLCDGMGGLKGGALVSQTAVSTMINLLRQMRGDVNVLQRELIQSIKRVQEVVLALAREKQMLGQSGTTLLVTVFKEGNLFFGAVGDSRIYLLREKRLIQVNTEHNYRLQLVEEVKKGTLSRAEALEDPNGDKLISFIGIPELTRMEVSFSPFLLQKKDKVLLASDGLFNTLSEEEISSILQHQNTRACAQALVQRTISKRMSHQDNVSVIVIEYRGE